MITKEIELENGTLLTVEFTCLHDSEGPYNIDFYFSDDIDEVIATENTDGERNDTRQDYEMMVKDWIFENENSLIEDLTKEKQINESW